MNTDYNLYKIFLYLYEERSISKTANRLYVSQPAISYSLKELENQLGYTLFYRNSKGIEPTLEADELYSYISTAFDILNDAEEHIKNLNNLDVGCIRIGTPSHIGIFYLTKYIEQFRKDFPGVKFELICEPTDKMVEMLESRKLDIIVDTLPISCKKDVTKITLKRFDSCFAYNKKILKDVKIESVKDLEKYPLLLPDRTTSMRNKLNEFMDSNNVKLNPVIENWTAELMIEMIRRGMGIGYIERDLIENVSDKEDLEVISFDDLPYVDVCCVYINNYINKATKKFIDILSEKVID